ncbi:MAG: hypothetical protein JRF53_00535 [Deltaproteobacteria bacterium]|nr:hypothetical protein [Deltaproteobacteria bacterium]
MSKGTIVSGGADGDYNVEIDMLDGDNQTMQAWCADKTEDLSGEVGVIEIAGDIDKGVNIQPGHDGNAVYDAARDGAMKQIQPFPATSPTGEVYWNWAMRPGWQKWRTKYRYGTITHIYSDTDKCDLTLEACLATDTPDGKSLDVNQETSLGDVPIEYMDCDASAFSDGDEVIVELSHDANNNWINPKVIGFKSEPKACCFFRFSLVGADGPALIEGVLFSVYNEEQVAQSVINLEYDEDEEYWGFALNRDQEGYDCSGPFWVRYMKGGYKTTQYLAKDTEGDWWKETDMIIFGDGTLYEDVMQLLESETDYWEDWEDDLICGKHEWEVGAYIDGDQLHYQDSCVTLPINETGQYGSYLDLSLENEVISMTCNTVHHEDDNTTSLAQMDVYNSESDSMPHVLGRKIKIKFSNYSYDYSGPYPYVEGNIYIKSEAGKLLILWFAYATDKAPASPVDRKYVWIGDEIEVGEELILDLFEERFELFEPGDPIDRIGFFGMGNLGGNINFSIDYIHFAKWEEFGATFCANQNWACYMEGMPEYLLCPPDTTWIYDDEENNGGTGIMKLNEIEKPDESSRQNYSLQLECHSNAGQSLFNFIVWERDRYNPDEEHPLLGTLKFKFLNIAEANLDGEDQYGYGMIYIRQNSNEGLRLYFSASQGIIDTLPYTIGSKPALCLEWIRPLITLGEETVIDLTQYASMAPGEEIQYFTISLSTEGPLAASIAVELDYIDFVY